MRQEFEGGRYLEGSAEQLSVTVADWGNFQRAILAEIRPGRGLSGGEAVGFLTRFSRPPLQSLEQMQAIERREAEKREADARAALAALEAQRVREEVRNAISVASWKPGVDGWEGAGYEGGAALPGGETGGGISGPAWDGAEGAGPGGDTGHWAWEGWG